MLYFNPKKCFVMHFGRNNPNKDYSIEDQTLEKTEEEKDLAVIMNKNFSFSTHINKSISKANQSLGIMQCTFTYTDEEFFRDIYLTFVRPHLEYCVQVWSPYLRCEVDKIEKVQRHATKLVPSLHELPYKECLKKLKAHFSETLLKVAKNFLCFEMPLSVFWRDTQRKRRKRFAGERLLFCTDAPFSTAAPHCCCYDALL